MRGRAICGAGLLLLKAGGANAKAKASCPSCLNRKTELVEMATLLKIGKMRQPKVGRSMCTACTFYVCDGGVSRTIGGRGRVRVRQARRDLGRSSPAVQVCT